MIISSGKSLTSLSPRRSHRHSAWSAVFVRAL